MAVSQEAPRQGITIKSYKPMEMNRLALFERVNRILQFESVSLADSDRKLVEKTAFSVYRDLVGLGMRDEADEIRGTKFASEPKTAIIYPGATPGEQVVFDATKDSQNNNL